MDGPGEELLARAALAQDQDRHIPPGNTRGPADGVPDLRAVPDDRLEALHLLRALAGEPLELGVGIPQDLRHVVDDQVERDLGDQTLPSWVW